MTDFYVAECGGQHTDLILNRFLQMGYTARIVPSDTPVTAMSDSYGVIISGGPRSVYEKDRFQFDPRLLTSGKPMLGICYGMQAAVNALGGEVYAGGREYGESRIHFRKSNHLFDGCRNKGIVWNNHGDSVRDVDEQFHVLGVTDKGVIGAVAAKDRDIYAVQFHPELTHTEDGTRMLQNFAEEICHAPPAEMIGFNAGAFVDEAVHQLRSEVGDKTLVLLSSGGVDSTTCMALAKRAGIKVLPIHLDMGIERYIEADYVAVDLGKIFGTEIYIHDTGDWVVPELAEYRNPVEMREAFIRLYSKSALGALRQLGIDQSGYVFGQGSLATDRRESGKSAASGDEDAGGVAIIKPHHNVGFVAELGLPVLEILGRLSKGEVRQVAAALGLPERYVRKWPFPGPGFSVRLMVDYDSYDDDLAATVCSTAARFGFRGYVLPFKTIGIKGDQRSFEHPALLTGYGEWPTIRAASKALAEELPINRTLYLWGEDPGFSPADFREIQRLDFTPRNLDILRSATYLAEKIAVDYGVNCAQLPVVAHPGVGGMWTTIRDVDTVDFRSIRPLHKPGEMSLECCDEMAKRITSLSEVLYVCFDASTKPAATTEFV